MNEWASVESMERNARRAAVAITIIVLVLALVWTLTHVHELASVLAFFRA